MNVSGLVSIDSCKLRIDLDKVEVVNEELLTRWAQISEYGEIEGTNSCENEEGQFEIEVDERAFKRKRFTVKKNGVTTSYLIEKRKTYGEVMKESLLILFNSKLLKRDYLQGITLLNIGRIYDEILTQHVVKMPYEVFLKGALTDTDIKKDFLVESIAQQKDIVKFFGDRTKLSRNKTGGHDMRTSDSNIGIQWSKREVATNGKPHVKMYSKDIELEHSSNEFWQSELQGCSLPPIMRLEGTIKNKKHYKYMTNTDKDDYQQFTLNDILSLEHEEKERMLSEMFIKHLENESTVKREKTGNPTMSEVFAMYMLDTIGSLAMAKVKIEDYTTNKSQTYKARQLLEKVWNEYTSQEVKDSAKPSDQIIHFVYGKS